jgi:hypothetical protein
MNNYQGKDFAYRYKQTPNKSNTELITNLSIPQYNPEVIIDFPAHIELHMKGLKQHINNLMQKWQKSHTDILIDSIVQKAIKETATYSEDELTKESIEKLSQTITEEYVHYIYKIPSELPIELNDT